jgi:hypothetical protein
MVTYRCSSARCALASEHFLPVVAAALGFECPECHSALAADGEDTWSLRISSEPQLWPSIEASYLPFFAADEISRLRSLFRDGQIYGAILQLRDVLEVLLKLPVLFGASRIYSFGDTSAAEREFLFSIISKPLSLGDWRAIAAKSLAEEVRLPNTVREIISKIAQLFDQQQIPTWRNNTIGHGALGFDTDSALRSDIKKKLSTIANHLRAVAQLYGNVDVHVGLAGQMLSLRGRKPDVLANASSALYLTAGSDVWPIYPYVHLIDGGIFFFDAYYHYRHHTTALLNYTDGRKRLEKLQQLAELYEHLVLTTRLKIAGSDFEPQILSKRQDDLLVRDWQPEELVEPSALVSWVRTSLDTYDKGVFLLQMERGCGKTTFCRYVDGLGASRTTFDHTVVRVHYGNDLYGYLPGNFVWSVTDGFRTEERGSNSIIGNIPYFSPNAEDKPRALVEHLEFFLTQRRRLFGDQRLLLVIDAIDETPLGGLAPIMEFLPNADVLDSGIFILITARIDSELQAGVRERITKLSTTSRLVVTRDEPANQRLLTGYLRKTNIHEALWERLLAISERRFLYLRTLISALSLFEAKTMDGLPKGGELIEALLEKLSRIYGPRHYEHLSEIISVLAFAYEPLSLQEICFLISEPYPSLRTSAFLRDISGLLRVDRDDGGNVYSIGHEEVSTTLRMRFAERQRLFVELWVGALRDDIAGLLDHPSFGLDYLLAHFVEYAPGAAADLTFARLASRLVTYSARDEGSATFERRRRLILLSAFRWLDLQSNSAAYVSSAAIVQPGILAEVLERRLTEGDSTLLALARDADLSDPSTFVFFRVLAASAYHTQNYRGAVTLADKLYSRTRLPIDLINLALMLKGTDTAVDGAYTMARSRQIVDELASGDYAPLLTPMQRGYLLYTIGRVFSDTIEHVDDAMAILMDGLKAFEATGHELSILALKNAIALSLFDSGDFRRAATAAQEIVAAMRVKPALFPKDAYQAATINFYILSFLADEEQPDPFEMMAISSWEIRAFHINNRFLVEYLKGNSIAAEALAAECLRLTEDRKGVYSRAAILNNAGVVFRRSSDLAAAHEICKRSGYSVGEAITGYNLGLQYSSPHGVIRRELGLLWPCVKNFDILAFAEPMISA